MNHNKTCKVGCECSGCKMPKLGNDPSPKAVTMFYKLKSKIKKKKKSKEA